MTPRDPYQDRYVAHQSRKREVLAELLAERHSERRFADENVSDDDLIALVTAAEHIEKWKSTTSRARS